MRASIHLKDYCHFDRREKSPDFVIEFGRSLPSVEMTQIFFLCVSAPLREKKSVKHARTVLTYQQIMIKLVPYGPCQYDLLKIPAFSHHVIHRVFMADVNHILFNNRASIEIRGYIMTGGAYDLYATLIS